MSVVGLALAVLGFFMLVLAMGVAVVNGIVIGFSAPVSEPVEAVLACLAVGGTIVCVVGLGLLIRDGDR